MQAMECEECGRDDLPLLVFVAGLTDPDKPDTIHQISIYICTECAETSRTIH